MRRLLALLIVALTAATPARAADFCSPGGVLGCAFVSPLFAGTVEVQSGGKLLLPDGNATTSLSWGFKSDDDGTGTGMFRAAANSIGVSVNGVERFRFDVGTTSLMMTNGQFSNTLGLASTLTGVPDLNFARGGTTGALRIISGTAPTCTGNCGTSPSVSGNNTNMRVTIGTSPPAAATFTVTFNGTWTNAPNCQATRATTGTTPVVTGVVTTTTTAVVNLSANLVASELFSIFCVGP